ncbi:hypothetical protein BT93_B0788 [Corymbia citriodora subsp. variegata]|nr:hypothetical protein BT93_B0788 [Corymbia citriodora subsp. variegata]
MSTGNFETIDKLISQGINAGDVKKLQDAGIYTCNGLLMRTEEDLTGIKGLSKAKVDKILEAAEKIVNFGFITGIDALLRLTVVRITTRSQALDELLGSGIETLGITEAFGKSGSGKTQLADTLCVTTQLPTHLGGGNGKVAYIDTKGTFCPHRILPIAKRFGMDPGALLDNRKLSFLYQGQLFPLFWLIIYAHAYTYEDQYNMLPDLAAKRCKENHLDYCKNLYKCSQADPEKPAGGDVLAYLAKIRQGKGGQRVCKVFKAPHLPNAEAISFLCQIFL